MFKTFSLPAKLLVGGTLGANIYVFARWNTIVASNTTPGTPERRRVELDHVQYMTDNYTVSRRNLDAGRYWTLLTAAFSHKDLAHIAVNMYTFYQAARFGLSMGIGPARLSALCLGSALTASVGSLYEESTRKEIPGRPAYATESLGASGLVEGLLVGTMMCYPRSLWTLMFIPVPIQGWMIVGGFCAWDAYKLSLARRDGPSKNWMGVTVGYAAHLGGAAFGAAFYMLLLRRPFGPRFGGVFAPRRRV